MTLFARSFFLLCVAMMLVSACSSNQADTAWEKFQHLEKSGKLSDAFKELERAAALGHVEAQFTAACKYSDGKSLLIDYPKAVGLAQDAANKGYAPAQELLATFYLNGTGVSKNDRKAFSLYKESAEHGNETAQWKLGTMYLGGIGVEKDMLHGYMWVSIAANKGNEFAIRLRNNVGQLLSSWEYAEATRLAEEWKPRK